MTDKDDGQDVIVVCRNGATIHAKDWDEADDAFRAAVAAGEACQVFDGWIAPGMTEPQGMQVWSYDPRDNRVRANAA